MEAEKIGIREFRENLAGYLEGGRSLAITRHGETLGFFIPAQKRNRKAAVEAMRAAAKELDAIIASWGASEDELMGEYKEIRPASREKKKRNALEWTSDYASRDRWSYTSPEYSRPPCVASSKPRCVPRNMSRVVGTHPDSPAHCRSTGQPRSDPTIPLLRCSIARQSRPDREVDLQPTASYRPLPGFRPARQPGAGE